MAQVNKIDSNITGLAYAEEASLGVISSPAWKRLEPNSYNDFGGELTTVAPNPINPSRQRKKGVVTDLDATGGFNHNLTSENLKDLLQGVMFADLRRKGFEEVTAVDVDLANPDEYEVASTTGFFAGSLIKGVGFANADNNALNVVTAVVSNTSVEVADGQLVTEASPPSGAYIQVVGFRSASGDVDVDASGDLPILTSSTLDFTTLGLVEGQWIFLGGDLTANQFSTAANNGFKRIRTITANALTIDKSATTMATEANTTKLVDIYFGDVLKNETGTSIVRRSYHIERTLGAPDDASPSQIQSEYLKGAIPNEFTLNVPTANLVNIDLSFIATDHQQNDGATGPLQTSVAIPEAADVFNTSSDFSRIKMSTVSSVDDNPTALFAFITEATITVNNNLSPNKAVGTLGAFDVTAGTFQVSGSITAYFGNISAIQAVRNNSDVTLDMAIVKENQGIVIDIPLVSLGDGRLNVEQDQPITLPLSMDAATAEDVAATLGHTLLLTFFKYLPTAAE
jgi:hypothetical protein